MNNFRLLGTSWGYSDMSGFDPSKQVLLVSLVLWHLMTRNGIGSMLSAFGVSTAWLSLHSAVRSLGVLCLMTLLSDTLA